ncbi:protein Mis18-alpha [Austrofundulus limnaeus]|uniref:Protein Mis18-alpha n=1 Tax=Austrofundulus limnaeus TaxID=52670 RepID=A0A2I4AT96_AUSLI|nr:PREDICTED: protein Mis18-alpha [Austrofundulus limnaeus]
MAMKEKLTRHRPKCINETFEATSVDSTTVEEKLSRVEEEEDGPVVFFCGKCKLPVGDSLSWDGAEDGQNQIRLKRVTDNVLIAKENRLLEVDKKSQCLVVDLICQGCHSVLGMIYKSTPRSMDNKRFTFCLNVADIESYVLGSANQTLSAEVPKEQPVTLEYRGMVEQQLAEMKMLVMSMALRLEEIETGLQEESNNDGGH